MKQKLTNTYFPSLEEVKKAAKLIAAVNQKPPLQYNINYSNSYQANISFKREDLQLVRSYKIRGAYNKMAALAASQSLKQVICASAGNHAQGVAYACQKLGIRGIIVMPKPTPKQKIAQVKMFGGQYITIQLYGDSYDDAYNHAITLGVIHDATFVHPFDDEKVIEGQATIGLELIDQAESEIDYLFLPVGGGGLAAGVGAIMQLLSPKTKVIGVEPAGAASLSTSLKTGQNTSLKEIDKFVDGAAVKQIGALNFTICQQTLDEVVTIPEGKVCRTILDLYNKEAIVAEPAGALSIAALDLFKEEIKGKNVVCVVSGSNNDIARMEEIKERALLYSGLKHYFIVKFPQRAGALKEFVAQVLGEHDDITHFEYNQKNSREKGSAVVGIELKHVADFESLLSKMKERNFYGDYINNKPDLLNLLI